MNPRYFLLLLLLCMASACDTGTAPEKKVEMQPRSEYLSWCMDNKIQAAARAGVNLEEYCDCAYTANSQHMTMIRDQSPEQIQPLIEAQIRACTQPSVTHPEADAEEDN